METRSLLGFFGHGSSSNGEEFQMLKGSPLSRTFALVLFGAALGLSAEAARADDQQCAVRTDGSSICVGDRVIDYRQEMGVIENIYSDNSAVIKFDDNSEFVETIEQLAREVQCLYGFCAGDRVEDGSGSLGHNEDLFENGL